MSRTLAKVCFGFLMCIEAMIPAACLAAYVKIACIGDSSTYGYKLNQRDINSYPAMLRGPLGNSPVDPEKRVTYCFINNIQGIIML